MASGADAQVVLDQFDKRLAVARKGRRPIQDLAKSEHAHHIAAYFGCASVTSLE